MVVREASQLSRAEAFARSVLTPEEMAKWEQAVASANAAGTFFLAQPHHARLVLSPGAVRISRPNWGMGCRRDYGSEGRQWGREGASKPGTKRLICTISLFALPRCLSDRAARKVKQNPRLFA
jgi:hypothetical protein